MNVLILGLGSIGRRHARTIRALDPTADIRALRSGKGGEPEPGVRDIGDIADAPRPLDLAVVATPTDLHRSGLESVLPLRPFVFIEKPLALTVEDGEAMARAIDAAGLRSYVGCHLRFHPCLRWVRQVLRESPRPIRSVHAVCRSWMPDWQPGRDHRKSFRADAARSGGVHVELIHEIDYLTWIFGMPRDCALDLRPAPELELDLPAIAHYELAYPEYSATIDLSYASKATERMLRIDFGSDQWTADLLAFTVTSAAGAVLFRSDQHIDDVYAEQMRHVLACAGGSAESMHTAAEAAATLRIALGVL